MRGFVMTVFVMQIVSFAFRLAAYLIKGDKRVDDRTVSQIVIGTIIATWAGFLLFGE